MSETKADIVAMGTAFAAKDSIPQLRSRYAAAAKRSGLKTLDFKYEIITLANVLDGRCPDGCCGNEDQPNWGQRLTPGEWAALAVTLAPRLAAKASAKKVRRA